MNGLANIHTFGKSVVDKVLVSLLSVLRHARMLACRVLGSCSQVLSTPPARFTNVKCFGYWTLQGPYSYFNFNGCEGLSRPRAVCVLHEASYSGFLVLHRRLCQQAQLLTLQLFWFDNNSGVCYVHVHLLLLSSLFFIRTDAINCLTTNKTSC